MEAGRGLISVEQARGDQGRLHVPATQPGRVRTVGRKATAPLGPCPAAPAGKEWGSPEGLRCGGLLIMEVH